MRAKGERTPFLKPENSNPAVQRDTDGRWPNVTYTHTKWPPDTRYYNQQTHNWLFLEVGLRLDSEAWKNGSYLVKSNLHDMSNCIAS